jgi:hypothetical protein
MFPLSCGVEAGVFVSRGAVVQEEQPNILHVEQELTRRQTGDQTEMLLVQVQEGVILVKDVHPLPLVEHNADRRILEDVACLVLQKDAHLLIDTDELFSPGAEGLRGLDQEVEQRRVTHQAVDLIDGDDARRLVRQTVAADGGEYLRVGDGLQDRVAFHLVEAEHARRHFPAKRQIHVGRTVQERRKWTRAATQTRNFIGKVAGNLPILCLVAHAGQHIAHQIGSRGEVGRNRRQISIATIDRLQCLTE